MRVIINIVFVVFLFGVTPSFAQQLDATPGQGEGVASPSHHQGCCGHHASGDPVAQALDEFHHAVEGSGENHHHHHHGEEASIASRATSFFQGLARRDTWIELAKKFAQTFVRPDHLIERLSRTYYVMVSRPDTGTHAKNLVWLFPMSHLAETVGGVALLGFGDNLFVRTVGAIIPIPGLDPMCLALYAMYGNASFRQGVTQLREFVSGLLANEPLLKSQMESFHRASGNRFIPQVTLPSDRVIAWLNTEALEGVFFISQDGKNIQTKKGNILWTWFDGKYGFFLKEVRWVGTPQVEVSEFLDALQTQIKNFPGGRGPGSLKSGLLRSINFIHAESTNRSENTTKNIQNLKRFWNGTESQPWILTALPTRSYLGLSFRDYAMPVGAEKNSLPKPVRSSFRESSPRSFR